jgi:hypothetical protein
VSQPRHIEAGAQIGQKSGASQISGEGYDLVNVSAQRFDLPSGNSVRSGGRRLASLLRQPNNQHELSRCGVNSPSCGGETPSECALISRK